MISNSTLEALDFIRDEITLLSVTPERGNKLKLMIQGVQDKIAEFAETKIKTQTSTYRLLRLTQFEIVDGEDMFELIAGMKNICDEAAEALYEEAIFEEMPEYTRNKYKTPEKMFEALR